MSDFTFPSVRLSSGITVYNHSSAHSFEFADGSVLAGVYPEQAKVLAGGDVVTPIDHLCGEGGGQFVVVEMGCSPVLAASLDEVQALCDELDPSHARSALFLVPYPYLTASWWDTDRWPSGVSGYSGPGRPTPGKFPPLMVDTFRVSPHRR